MMMSFRKNRYVGFREFSYYRFTVAAVAIALCVASSGLLYGQAKDKPAEAKPPAKVPAKPPVKEAAKPPAKVIPMKITASIYYHELEPKQLFQILSATFQVQFEGVEAVTGPITLISKEKVDMKGMLQLLNEVLAKQNKTAQQKGLVIHVVPRQDLENITIPLRYTNPQKVISTLKSLYMVPSTDKSEDKTNRPSFIGEHPTGQAVIVWGPREVLSEIEKYVKEKLDTKGEEAGLVAAPETSKRIKKNIPVKYADLEMVSQFLRDVYLIHRGATAEEKTRLASAIVPHPKRSLIVVVAPAEVIAEMEKVVAEELDEAPSEPPKPPMFQEYISLEYIDAMEFVYILRNNETLTERHGWLFNMKDFKRPANLLNKLMEHEDLLCQLIKGQFSQKMLALLKTYDGIVPSEALKETLVEEMNIIIQGSNLYDEDRLRHVQLPKELKRLIRQMGLDSSIIRINRMILEAAYPQEIDKIKYKFTTSVASNNILIVSSYDEKLLKKFMELKKSLDVDFKELRYIPLSYAKAEEVAGMLTKLYPEQLPTLPSELEQTDREKVKEDEEAAEEATLLSEVTRTELDGLGIYDPGVQSRISRSLRLVSKKELLIVPDKTRNYLMIYTYSRNFPKILDLIEELDKPQKQVFIDVYIAQVSLDDALEIGIDWGLGGPATNIERKGETIPYTLGQAFNTRQFIGTGLNYDFISENLEVYMRALHTTKNVDIMARPSILVKNNAEAEISLGRSVPIMSNVQTNITGLVTGKIKYEDVLTQLMVTPQIHPDNYVSLVITQTIDDVSAETFQISEEFDPQVILRRKANTTLRVKDGQTVCLGGFITDDTTSDERKVPLLGDIPVLGYLFKYSVQSRTKRELVIFITPHIMETPSELMRMTNEQRIFSGAEVQEERHNKDILEPQVDLRSPPFRAPLPEGP
jgi:type II secretory pathway component GspD/PulD (secretin)